MSAAAFDPAKCLTAARERVEFWQRLVTAALPANRRYFRERADYWLNVVASLERRAA